MSRVPIVIVFGATGTGKSKLAIQIAKKFNGEIISADSMQVYKGLDIASNKVTEADRAEVRHHMLDILRPMNRYSVTDYRNQALPIIDDVLKREKIPIIVGGTNYYIESILWKMLVEPEDEKSELIFNRYQVLKDPSKINKWKTYEASVFPLLKKSNQELVTDCDKKTDINKDITKDDINLLIEQIKSIDCDFTNSLENIQNSMNIAYKFYKRTLYGIESKDRVEKVTSSGDLKEPADSEIVDIVRLETTIMKEYICRNLEHMISFISSQTALPSSAVDVVWKDMNSSDDADLKDSYAVLSENENLPNFAFLNGSRFWNLSTVCRVLSNPTTAVSYVVYADQFRSIYECQQHLRVSCYLIFKKFLECVIALTKIRVKRLNLIRIVDDEAMLDFNNDEILAEIRLVDPDMVKEVHPNNRRKVIRVLQTYFSTGETMSEFQNRQHQLEGASSISGPLRFPEACLLWLHCDQEVLSSRLTVRVNEMMEIGLIEELLEFHKQYNIQRLAYNLNVDYSKGIFQSIGLKEFHSYLMLDEEERNSKKGRKLLDDGIELLKIATIKYSKYQTRYMLNKFIKVPDTKKVPPVFQLDTTDLDKWQENVEQKAYHIVENYLHGKDMFTLDYSPIANQEPDLTRYEHGEYYCDICERLFIGAYQWQAHVSSKRHRKTLYSRKVAELKKKFASLKMTCEKSDDREEECNVQESI